MSLNRVERIQMVAQQRSKPGAAGHRTVSATRLGERLRELRMSTDTTQAEFAEKLGFSRHHQTRICDWENGFHLPGLPALKRYADHFDITVSTLLDGVL
jgi:DNA-binding XRE family transcriptional regulator